MQTDKLEEKRQKALAEAQEFESQLIAYKKDQEMQNALKTQELEFAKRSVADSQVCERRRQGYAVLCWREVQGDGVCVCKCVGMQARESDLRKLLETAKKDAEAEVKSLQERFELEAKTASKGMRDLEENLKKAQDDTKEWEKKHAALGVSMSDQVKRMQEDVEAKQAQVAALQEAVDNLEKVGGEKAKAENEVLVQKLEALQKKFDDVDTARVALQNQVTVSKEEQSRLDAQLQQVKRDFKESEERVKTLSNDVDRLTQVRRLQQTLGRFLSPSSSPLSPFSPCLVYHARILCAGGFVSL
jgi:hypothetical protein